MRILCQGERSDSHPATNEGQHQARADSGCRSQDGESHAEAEQRKRRNERAAAALGLRVAQSPGRGLTLDWAGRGSAGRGRSAAGRGGRFAVPVHGKRPPVCPSLNVDHACYFYFSKVFLVK